MAKRKKLSADAKMRLMHAYEYRCGMCRVLLPPTVEIDHITPLHSWLWRHTTQLDPNAQGNLQPLCPGCHAMKSQNERLARPKGSAVACECGAVHSIYFKPQCDHLRRLLLLLSERCKKPVVGGPVLGGGVV
jgi:hypothetical protein